MTCTHINELKQKKHNYPIAYFYRGHVEEVNLQNTSWTDKLE